MKIYINQFTNECDEPILNDISDNNLQNEDKINDNKEEEKNEITEGNKEEYSKEITNEIDIKGKITENQQDEENLKNKEPKNKDIDNNKLDYNEFKDDNYIIKETIKNNDINNKEKKDNEIKIIDDVIIQEKKSKCNCDCDCCRKCNCDCDDCCDSCGNCDCCDNCNCECKLICCNSFDLYNNYKMQISFLIYLIQNIIYLSIFLLFFLDYNGFSFKLMISPTFFTIAGIIGSINFLSVKYFQFKDVPDCLSNNGVSIIFMIGITFSKTIFLLGWPSLTFENYNYNKSYTSDNQGFKNLAIIYLIYFSFSIIYYFTLSLYVCLNNRVNYFLFLFIAVIYITIEFLILYFISLVEIIIYGLIICSLEVLLLYIGIGLAICRKVLNNETEVLNSLHIEIFRLYPLLLLFSIPTSIIIIVIIIVITCICGK